jgi:hypothetical protein
MLSVVCAECIYADCHYAKSDLCSVLFVLSVIYVDCHCAESHLCLVSFVLSVIMLSHVCLVLFVLSLIYAECPNYAYYSESRNDRCCFAECCYAEGFHSVYCYACFCNTMKKALLTSLNRIYY